MSIGTIFLVVAFALFFFAGVGVTFIPNPVTWGFAALTLGFLTAGYKFPKIGE